jgi:hypothetical protein
VTACGCERRCHRRQPRAHDDAVRSTDAICPQPQRLAHDDHGDVSSSRPHPVCTTRVMDRGYILLLPLGQQEKNNTRPLDELASGAWFRSQAPISPAR